jgi:hypothetical protein
MLGDSYDTFNTLKKYFYRLLNAHGFSDRRKEIHIAETLITEKSCFQTAIVIEKLESYKSPIPIKKSPVELI